jgi:hypothetical protein
MRNNISTKGTDIKAIGWRTWSGLSGGNDRFRAGMSSGAEKDTPAQKPSLPDASLLHVAQPS